LRFRLNCFYAKPSKPLPPTLKAYKRHEAADNRRYHA
jgi:hypothetical protein